VTPNIVKAMLAFYCATKPLPERTHKGLAIFFFLINFLLIFCLFIQFN